MTEFARGQKGKIIDMGCTEIFSVTLNISGNGMDIDTSCFGLDASDNLSDDRYMIFFNQKACPGDGVVLNTINEISTFHIAVSQLPDFIKKLVITISINGEGIMKQLGRSSLHLGNTDFYFSGSDFQYEKAVIVGEIYKYDNQWRFGAVGQGFNGGLSTLLQRFGGTEEATVPDFIPTVVESVPSKITIKDYSNKLLLEKNGMAGFGRICINFNWNKNAVPRSEAKKPHINLCCMFEMSGGESSCVQALGGIFGRFSQPPYIYLDSAAISSDGTGEESIFINGDKFQHLKRVLIFAFIENGTADWAAADGAVTIEAAGQPQVKVELDNGTKASMCAIAMIENNGGHLQITKLVKYFDDTQNQSAHEQINDCFGFGVRFTAGGRD